MINTGKAPISIMTYLAIMSINLIVNLPGLAVAPMEGRLKELLNAPELEVQLLTTLPNFLIIPFVLLSGKLSLARHKIPIIVSGLIIYSGCAIAYLLAHSMLALIIISCLLGCGAGLLIPFAAGLIADTFTGKFRMKQMGWKSGISNSSVVIATFIVGWLIESSNWHLPFVVYLTALIPLVFSFWLKNVPDMKPGYVPSASTQQTSNAGGNVAAGNALGSEAPSKDGSKVAEEPETGEMQSVVPFTREMIEVKVEFDLSAGKGKNKEDIRLKEIIEVEKAPDDLAERAVEIAEEASELSLDALKIARGETVTQAEIDRLTRQAEHILSESKGELPHSKHPHRSKVFAQKSEEEVSNKNISGEGKQSISVPKTPKGKTSRHNNLKEKKAAATPLAAVTATTKPENSSTVGQGNAAPPSGKEFFTGRIWALIGVYFFITFTSIAITNYCSQLVAFYKWKSTIAGDVTAVFFLFVLLPGYCLPFFVRILRGSTFFWTAIMILVGLGLFVFIEAPWAMFVGSALTGLGYGICQPVLYDKASYTVTNPLKATLALAFVLTANYLAIAVEPFVISGIGNLIHTPNQNLFAFEFSLGMVIAYTIISLFLRKKFAFSVDKSYYA